MVGPKIAEDDGLPIDVVGPWSKEKHTRLRKYVGITSATRRKWIQGSGCATYIDLFCGTGRAVIRDSGERINGSPLVAFEASRASGVPFSEIHIADLSQESSKAAEHRLNAMGANPTVHVGEATDTASAIVKSLNPQGLHFVFLDPYKLEPLSFSIIETFASLRYVDLLIHISVLDLQRNMERYANTVDGPLDRFAPGWRPAVNLKQSKAAARAAYVAYWASKMDALGFQPARYELVSGQTKNQRLYWLILVSRHKIANEFWDKIRNVSGQGELL
jgi:three-Cys-motif partner protein